MHESLLGPKADKGEASGMSAVDFRPDAAEMQLTRRVLTEKQVRAHADTWSNFTIHWPSG